VASRHLIDRSVVQIAAGPEVLDQETAAVRQGLAQLGHGAGTEHVFDLALAHNDVVHRLAVDVQDVADHLDAVARQADHALDVVGLVVARQLEHDDVAAFRCPAEQATFAYRQVDGQTRGILRIAIGPLGHDDVVALVEVRLH
jgi:hypothetical protein